MTKRRWLKNLNQLFMASILIGTTSGCSAVNTFQKSQQDRRDRIELKKGHYLALKHDISNNALLNQAASLDIKETYGPPDDIFYSNSNGRSFQIWTYNISKDRLDNNSGFDPIILYIENDKLISWKY